MLAPNVEAPDGSIWIHKDYDKAVEPWAVEGHIGPAAAAEGFGDVASFVEYVRRFCDTEAAFLTWNSQGLTAVLDYHKADGTAGRMDWTAKHLFERTREWNAWTQLANGSPRSQQDAVEKIEDLLDSVVLPAPGDLMNLLRTLKGQYRSNGESTLNPDGTYKVTFGAETGVQAGAESVAVPNEIFIRIPVIKGHTEFYAAAVSDDLEVDEDDPSTFVMRARDVVYGIPVKVRVSADEHSQLKFRFSMPLAEKVLDTVIGELVEKAKEELGIEYSLLRAQG